MLIILLLSCIILVLIAFSNSKISPAAPTAAGSIVMALGIFLQGAWQQLSGQMPDSVLTRILVIGTAMIWVYLLVNYIGSIRRSSFYQDHLEDPVMRIAMGTWVAGTSTLLINVHASFGTPWLNESIHIIAMLNIGLWLFLLYFICLSGYQILIQQQTTRVHGTILLSTVATQSIVLLFHQVFRDGYMAAGINQALIGLGLLFYICGVFLIVYRYRADQGHVVENWTDTNCVLYGALAITGAAVQSVHAWSDSAIFILWWVTLIILIIVEGIESVRAMRRIRQKGWRSGVGVYNIAQWTRLFTLGMFYFFTLRTQSLYIQHTDSSLALGLHHWILTAGAWIIGILLVYELILWIPAVGKHEKEMYHTKTWSKHNNRKNKSRI